MIYIMFVLLSAGDSIKSPVTTLQKEFPDKKRCELALTAIKENLKPEGSYAYVKGFCLETKK